MNLEKQTKLSCLQRRKTEITEAMLEAGIALDFYRDQAQKQEDFLKKKQREKVELEKEILELVESGEDGPS